VAQTCNPSYLGGRDQEDQGSKPAQAKSSRDPISKKPFTKKKKKMKALSSSLSTAKKKGGGTEVSAYPEGVSDAS
jgi:hypothetical protein